MLVITRGYHISRIMSVRFSSLLLFVGFISYPLGLGPLVGWLYPLRLVSSPRQPTKEGAETFESALARSHRRDVRQLRSQCGQCAVNEAGRFWDTWQFHEICSISLDSVKHCECWDRKWCKWCLEFISNVSLDIRWYLETSLQHPPLGRLFFRYLSPEECASLLIRQATWLKLNGETGENTTFGSLFGYPILTQVPKPICPGRAQSSRSCAFPCRPYCHGFVVRVTMKSSEGIQQDD